MKLKRITSFFLTISIVGAVTGLFVIGLDIPFRFPLTPCITLSSFIFAILHAVQREGWKKTLLLVVLVVACGLFFESLGVATGLVYGPYHYTDQLGPKFLGLVPWLIPVAWTFMMYPSMVIATAITPASIKGVKKGLVIAALSGVIMTAWDVVMDPMMVLGGNWVWDVKGAFFGIPLQNYWGWWLTSFCAVGLYRWLSRNMPEKITIIPDQWAIYLYAMTGISSILSCMILGLGGPALAGFFAMLPWAVMGIWQSSHNNG